MTVLFISVTFSVLLFYRLTITNTMKNCINILGNNQSFPYIIEYSKNAKTSMGHNATDGDDILWDKYMGVVRLFGGDVDYYRDNNDWYAVDRTNMTNQYVPTIVRTSNIKIYIPIHSISTYVKNVRYGVALNTWINGVKVDLGTFIFRPTDTYAIPTGPIKRGNNEYYECIDFNIIDPFYLIYEDGENSWAEFRNKVCGEPLGLNCTHSALQVSLFVIDEYDNRYMIKDEWIGGCTTFTVAEDSDYLTLKLSPSYNPVGFNFELSMNEVYDNLLEYLRETYSIVASNNDISFDIVIKSKDAIMICLNKSGTIGYDGKYNSTNNCIEQNVKWDRFVEEDMIKTYFSNWNNFEEGWNIVASMTVVNDAGDELLTLVSNEVPITQELFSKFTNGGTEKILEEKDMIINTYNVVNKKVNEIVQIERPNESKANIIQPVFFRVKDLETLTLHPIVTENVSINLDDYKSKVEKFTLLIEGCKFEQIGSNSYGILFKITANTLPADATTGTYYVLDENLELVTTGKYSCVR